MGSTRTALFIRGESGAGQARASAARPLAPRLPIVCAACGEQFEGTSWRRYCKPECYPRSDRGKKVTALCAGCGEPFEARARDVERGWGRFCTKACSLRARSSPAVLA